jgi:hypothetical protein
VSLKTSQKKTHTNPTPKRLALKLKSTPIHFLTAKHLANPITNQNPPTDISIRLLKKYYSCAFRILITKKYAPKAKKSRKESSSLKIFLAVFQAASLSPMKTLNHWPLSWKRFHSMQRKSFSEKKTFAKN